jgi:hypothetical protein
MIDAARTVRQSRETHAAHLPICSSNPSTAARITFAHRTRVACRWRRVL